MIDSPGREALTLVTVVFEAELALLQLQARSLARVLDPGVVSRIIVIDNSACGLPGRSRAKILREYGELAPIVEILDSQDVSGMPRATGWNSQQVLKLAVARLIDTDKYLTLDAKNHLIRPTSVEDFVASDGRPFANFHSYEFHPLRPSLERVFRFVGWGHAESLHRFTATATPFCLVTGLVCSLMDDIERTRSEPFATVFIDQRLTEYFLYSSWLLSQGYDLDEIYDPSGIDCPAVWPKGASVAGVRSVLESVADRDPALIAVHRTALARMNREATGQLERFWVERGLFHSFSAAKYFVVGYRIRYVTTMILKKWRERHLGG